MIPSKIKLHREKGSLELSYPDGKSYTLSGEYLRVHSPSAEVRGHGPGQEVLQHGKKNVKITRLETTGNYALTLYFSDDHDSGIYLWEYLYDLATNYTQYWPEYLAALQAAGKHRDRNIQVVKLMDPTAPD